MLVSQLYEPYEDNPSTSGFMRLSPEVLDTIIPKFLKDGWQVVSSFLSSQNLSDRKLWKNVHAIGDRSNGLVLDAFEKAVRDHHVDLSQLRPRLEHAQIMTPKDMKRLGQLGGASPSDASRRYAMEFELNCCAVKLSPASNLHMCMSCYCSFRCQFLLTVVFHMQDRRHVVRRRPSSE